MRTAPDPPLSSSLSDRADQPRGLALSCLQPELSGCRVDPGRAQRDRLLREHSVVVPIKFGAIFASSLRRRRPRPGDKCHLDEVFLRVQGELHNPWRAVDRHSVVLDILVQRRRDAGAAKRFFRRLLKGLKYLSRVLITDKLGSHGAANRTSPPSVELRKMLLPQQSRGEFASTNPSARAADAPFPVGPRFNPLWFNLGALRPRLRALAPIEQVWPLRYPPGATFSAQTEVG
jgi:hypothetical protein